MALLGSTDDCTATWTCCGLERMLAAAAKREGGRERAEYLTKFVMRSVLLLFFLVCLPATKKKKNSDAGVRVEAKA